LKIDRTNPAYQEYRAKFQEIVAAQNEETDKIPYSGGQDGPLMQRISFYLRKGEAE